MVDIQPEPAPVLARALGTRAMAPNGFLLYTQPMRLKVIVKMKQEQQDGRVDDVDSVSSSSPCCCFWTLPLPSLRAIMASVLYNTALSIHVHGLLFHQDFQIVSSSLPSAVSKIATALSLYQTCVATTQSNGRTLPAVNNMAHIHAMMAPYATTITTSNNDNHTHNQDFIQCCQWMARQINRFRENDEHSSRHQDAATKHDRDGNPNSNKPTGRGDSDNGNVTKDSDVDGENPLVVDRIPHSKFWQANLEAVRLNQEYQNDENDGTYYRHHEWPKLP